MDVGIRNVMADESERFSLKIKKIIIIIKNL